jgi:hypothetical protein
VFATSGVSSAAKELDDRKMVDVKEVSVSITIALTLTK